MVDTLRRFLPKAPKTAFAKDPYVLLTLHRVESTSNSAKLQGILSAVCEIAKTHWVAFPVHPRTLAAMEFDGIDLRGIATTPPLSYLEFLRLEANAALVITDSGGVQDETTALGVPCLT